MLFDCRKLLAAAASALIISGLAPSPLHAEKPPEKVTLQFHWKHEFCFAGFYAAKELGFYAEEGLDVDFREGGFGTVPIREVLEGRAQFGIASSELVLARLRGSPVVALAALMQHSPSALLVRADSGITSLGGLRGKTIEMGRLESDAEIYAMLMSGGIRPSEYRHADSTFFVRGLLAGDTDALSVYVTSQPFFLREAGVDYRLLRPIASHVDFYGPCLFTSEEEIEDRRDRVEAFRRASLRGWEYAFRHPEEIISLILEKYPPSGIAVTRELLRFEYEEMRKLALPDLVEFGHLNPGRLTHMAETFILLGLAEERKPLEGLVYESPEGYEFDWTDWKVKAGGGFALGASALLLLLYTMNRRLRREILQRARSENRLSRVLWSANLGYWDIDHQTGELYVGPHTARLLNCASGDIPARLAPRPNALGGTGGQGFFGELARRLADGTESFDFEYDIPLPGNDIRGVLCRGRVVERDEQGAPLRTAGTLLDITQSRIERRELETLAVTDPLTGLWNRRHFFDSLRAEVEKSRRHDNLFSVAILDLDHFKRLNDTRGHYVGDEALRTFAGTLRASFRPCDLIARYGGEEFVILFADLDRHAAQDLLEAMRAKGAPPIPTEAGSIPCPTFSCGLADSGEIPSPGLSCDALVALADERLLVAKSTGRGRIVSGSHN